MSEQPAVPSDDAATEVEAAAVPSMPPAPESPPAPSAAAHDPVPPMPPPPAGGSGAWGGPPSGSSGQPYAGQQYAAGSYPGQPYGGQPYGGAPYPGQPGWNPPFPGQRSKVVAGILGIVLGGLGVHRFYLGYTGIGLAQIAVTIVTCGVGAIWGFIEGILILVGSGITTDAEGRPLSDT